MVVANLIKYAVWPTLPGRQLRIMQNGVPWRRGMELCTYEKAVFLPQLHQLSSLSAMFNLLHSSTTQELFEKHLCNQNSHYEKYGQFPLRREALSPATAKSIPFAVSKDEWDTKEDTSKSMKNALYVLQYAKRHLSSQSDIER